MADPFLEGLIGGLQQRQRQGDLLLRQRQFESSRQIQSLNTLLRSMEFGLRHRQQQLTEEDRPREQAIENLEQRRRVVEAGGEAAGTVTVPGEGGFTATLPSQAELQIQEVERRGRIAAQEETQRTLADFQTRVANTNQLLSTLDQTESGKSIASFLRSNPQFMAAANLGVSIGNVSANNLISQGLLLESGGDIVQAGEKARKIEEDLRKRGATQINIGAERFLQSELAKTQQAGFLTRLQNFADTKGTNVNVQELAKSRNSQALIDLTAEMFRVEQGLSEQQASKRAFETVGKFFEVPQERTRQGGTSTLDLLRSIGAETVE